MIRSLNANARDFGCKTLFQSRHERQVVSAYGLSVQF